MNEGKQQSEVMHAHWNMILVKKQFFTATKKSLEYAAMVWLTKALGSGPPQVIQGCQPHQTHLRPHDTTTDP